MTRTADDLLSTDASEEIAAPERRAALTALHRALVRARDIARRGDSLAAAVILDALEPLPLAMLNPPEFDDLFRLTLRSLAERFPGFAGIHDDFVAETDGY